MTADRSPSPDQLVQKVVDFLRSNPFFVSSLPTNIDDTHVGLTWTQLCVLAGLVGEGLKIQGRIPRGVRMEYEMALEDAGIMVKKIKWSNTRTWLWGVPRSMIEGEQDVSPEHGNADTGSDNGQDTECRSD